MVDALRLGIVGVGRMGALHARVLAHTPGIDLRAVVDARPDVVAALADEIGVAAMTSLDELIARDEIEAWLVATPTPSHPEVVDLALETGRHVLCEKPLALETGVGPGLGAKAAASSLILQVGFWRRFSPPWAKAKELLQSGVIGRPVLMRFAQWDAHPPPPAFSDPSVSGGLAIDCGVHEYDLAEWLTGSHVAEVFARNLPVVDQAVGESGDVDNLIAYLELSNGVSAIVDLSRNARYGDDVRTEILGSDGALFVDLMPGRTRLANARGIEVVAGSEVDDAMRAGILFQSQAFAARIRGEPSDSSIPGAEESERALAIGRGVQESASARQTVSILAHTSHTERLLSQPGNEIRI